MYGQTEATARMTYLPYKLAKNKIGSIGIPIPGGNITLRNNKKENNKNGEIIYKGKNVSMGYSKNYRDLVKADENKGILATGDLAKKDSKSFYYIIGRKKTFVQIFGHRINLEHIEEILKNKGLDLISKNGPKNNPKVFSHLLDLSGREEFSSVMGTYLDWYKKE